MAYPIYNYPVQGVQGVQNVYPTIQSLMTNYGGPLAPNVNIAMLGGTGGYNMPNYSSGYMGPADAYAAYYGNIAPGIAFQGAGTQYANYRGLSSAPNLLGGIREAVSGGWIPDIDYFGPGQLPGGRSLTENPMNSVAAQQARLAAAMNVPTWQVPASMWNYQQLYDKFGGALRGLQRQLGYGYNDQGYPWYAQNVSNFMRALEGAGGLDPFQMKPYQLLSAFTEAYNPKPKTSTVINLGGGGGAVNPYYVPPTSPAGYLGAGGGGGTLTAAQPGTPEYEKQAKIFGINLSDLQQTIVGGGRPKQFGGGVTPEPPGVMPETRPQRVPGALEKALETRGVATAAETPLAQEPTAPFATTRYKGPDYTSMASGVTTPYWKQVRTKTWG